VLINCVAYEGGKRLGDIPIADISEYVKRPGCFVWVALKDPEPAELAQMQEEFGLHELAVEDATRGHQRPKIEEYGETVFTVMHVPQLAGSGIRVGELDLFVGRNYVLSVRHGFEPGFQAVRDRAEAEPEMLRHGSGFVFYALMDNVADRYFPLVDALERELEAIESRIFDDELARANLKSLYELKWKLNDVRHAVEPLTEVLHRLYGGRVPSVCAGMQDYFRDVYDHLVRVSAQMDALRDMVVTALQVNLSTINMATTDVTRRLAAYAALVAVPTLIAGVYGMNFKHMPELQQPWGYPLAIAIMVAIDLFLWGKFRKRGWL
jgi:magnesium transporter